MGGAKREKDEEVEETRGEVGKEQSGRALDHSSNETQTESSLVG